MDAPIIILCFYLRLPRTAETLKYLVERKDADLNRPLKDGRTPLDLTNSHKLKLYLLSQGATPTLDFAKHYLPNDVYMNINHSTVVNIFLLGDSGSGRRTLAKSLQTEDRGFFQQFINQFMKVADISDKKAGILPHDFISNVMGPVTIYEFSGHREFYARQGALLGRYMANSPSIVLLLINLQTTDKEVRESLNYWLKCFCSELDLTLILIGTHADQIKSTVQSKLDLVRSVSSKSNVKCMITLDCRYAESPSMSELRSTLKDSCKTLRDSHQMAFTNHFFQLFLLEHFKNDIAITLGTAEETFTAESREGYWAFAKEYSNRDCLFKVCEDLNKMGNLIFIKNDENKADSLIILNKSALHSRIYNTVFDPKMLNKENDATNSTGVVPLSKLKLLLPEFNPDMIAQFLCQLGFCEEVKNVGVLSQARLQIKSVDDRFFFFPGLVHNCKPMMYLWPQEIRGYHSGWIFQCFEPEEHFSTQFLHLVLQQIIFHFTVAPTTDSPSNNHPALQRMCRIWKNGVRWYNNNGIEAIVEIFDHRRVVLMIRSRNKTTEEKIELARLRSAIILKVLEVKEKLHREIQVQEYLVLPEDVVVYPLNINRLKQQVKLVNVTQVAKVVIQAGTYVVVNCDLQKGLEEMLHFEPYMIFGEAIVKELFDKSTDVYDSETGDADMYQLYSRVHQETQYSSTRVAERHPTRQSHRQIESPSLSHHDFEGLHYRIASRKHSDESFVNVFSTTLHNSPLDSIHQLAQSLQLQMEAGISHFRSKLDELSIFAGRNPLDLAEGMQCYLIDETGCGICEGWG